MYDITTIRKDFPVLNEAIYLDNGATTQTPVPAVEAMNEYFYKYAANHGRGAHRLARLTTQRYEDARDVVAAFLNCESEGTIFTNNATKSINLVALGMRWNRGDHIITTYLEHHSNLLPWMRLRDQGVKLTMVAPDMEGHVDPLKVVDAITEDTRLVALNHVSNVLGSITDVKQLTKLIHNKNPDICVLVDGSQSAGHIPVDLKDIGCDMFVTPGHKGLLGPQGTGVLYLKDPDMIEPVILGGGAVHRVTDRGYELEAAPDRFEAGTPNMPGVIGLGRAVEYISDLGIPDIEKHEKMLAKKAASGLARIEGVEVYGPSDRAGVVPFNVKGMNPHDVAMILDETRRICVRSGYHCAMPSVDMLQVPGTVRASFALYNTEEEVNILIEGVTQVANLV